MESLYSVKLGKLIQEFRLEVLRGGAGYEDVSIRTEDVNRPGLQLTGFFDYFDAKRLQAVSYTHLIPPARARVRSNPASRAAGKCRISAAECLAAWAAGCPAAALWAEKGDSV